MNRVIYIILVIMFVVATACAGPVTIATVSWKTTTGGNWLDKSNWVGDKLPAPGTTVVIGATTGGNYEVYLNGTYSILGLILRQRLRIRGELRIVLRAMCNRGSYFSSLNNTCIQCPMGYYQDNPDHDTCLTCNPGTFNSKLGAIAKLDCKPCALGTYAPVQASSGCTACPQGAKCDKPGLAMYVPCNPGFYTSAPSQVVCATCPFPLRCSGGVNATCASGYAGSDCVACAPNHFHLGAACMPCTDVPIPAILLVFLAGILLFILARTGMNIGNLTQLKIFLSQAQFISISLSLDVSWPKSLLDFAKFLDLVNINFDIISPECYLGDTWNFISKFFVVIGLSLFMVIALEIVRFFVLVRRNRLARVKYHEINMEKDRKLTERANVLRRLMILILTVVYVPITKLFMQTFDCIGTSPRTMRYDTRVNCDTAGHTTIVIVSIIGLALFTAGVPIAVVMFMWRLKKREEKRIAEDREGVHTLDEGNTVARYGVLYESYNKDSSFYEAINMVRKAALVLVSVVLVSWGEAQGAIVLCVSLLFLGLTIRRKPYTMLVFSGWGFLVTDHGGNGNGGAGKGKSKSKGLDVLNTQEQVGNIVNAVVAVCAIISAAMTRADPTKKTPNTFITILSVIAIVLNLVFTVAVAAARKNTRAGVKVDIPKDAGIDDATQAKMKELKSKIKFALLDRCYEEAEQYVTELNKLRGRRLEELERIQKLFVDRVVDPEELEELDKQKQLYMPPSGANAPIPTAMASRMRRAIHNVGSVEEGDAHGSAGTLTGAVAVVEDVIIDALGMDAQELVRVSDEISTYIRAGTLVDDPTGFKLVAQLIDSVKIFKSTLTLALDKCIANERFKLARRFAEHMSVVDNVSQPDLITAVQTPMMRRTMTVCKDEHGDGSEPEPGPGPEKSTPSPSPTSRRFTARLNPKMWTMRSISTTDIELSMLSSADELQGVFHRFLDVALEEATTHAKAMETAAEAMSFAEANKALAKLYRTLEEARVHACFLLYRLAMNTGTLSSTAMLWAKFKRDILHLSVQERLKPMPPHIVEIDHDVHIGMQRYSKPQVPTVGISLDGGHVPPIPVLQNALSTAREEYAAAVAVKDWPKAKKAKTEIDRLGSEYGDAITVLIAWRVECQEFDDAIVLAQLSTEKDKLIDGIMRGE